MKFAKKNILLWCVVFVVALWEREALSCQATDELPIAAQGDYTLDPKPVWYQRNIVPEEAEPYKAPKDPEACGLYLKNLRYFTQRNLQLACGQPISPELSQKIKAIEWVDLDPDVYVSLFKAAVAIKENNNDVEQERINYWRDMLKQKKAVFQRMKENFYGYPRHSFGEPIEHANFKIVQLGYEAVATYSYLPSLPCDSLKRGSDTIDRPYFFIATDDLQGIYMRITSVIGQFRTGVLKINDRIYFETSRGNGDVHLGEFSSEQPESIEPICIFHYNEIKKGVN